ncbi:MAG: hypothetical protein ACOY40_01280 [Bacillota bacterium]
MFSDRDLHEIRLQLERACDQCLLTRGHCEKCNVRRLLGIISGVERGGQKPSYFIPGEELAVLTNPGSPEYGAVVEKWKIIVKQDKKRLVM